MIEKKNGIVGLIARIYFLYERVIFLLTFIEIHFVFQFHHVFAETDPFVIFIFGSDHHGVSDAGFAVCDLRDVLNGERRFRKSV